MRVFDPKFKKNIPRYFLQCFGVTIFIYIILQLIDVFLETTLVASLAATTFIIFTMPHKQVSKRRYIIGGYTVGLLIGSLGWLYHTSYPSISLGLVGAIVIGVSIFIMVITNTEHPPATAFAFGITVDGISIEIVLIVYAVTLSFLVIKKSTKKWLIDLL